LKIILASDDAASQVYVKNKLINSKKVGIDAELVKYPRGTAASTIIDDIQKFNEDKKVHGIIVQLPLPQDL
jgi:methylenetetrahydrofolate dehydrogenase (NADP+)/methenyltetrahydrofolate cyclohydrolase